MRRIERIILIDDNEVTNFYNMDLLSSLGGGWDIHVFGDAESALVYFEQNSVPLKQVNTLVLLDVKMPGQTGFDLLRELDELDLLEQENIRFCILTSSNLVRDLEEFEKFPMVTHYLEKPLDRDKVGSLLPYFKQRA